MRSFDSLKAVLASLGLGAHPGQPMVVAFADSLVLRESPLLKRIRAELRGLGAALCLVSQGQVFTFHPDDQLDLDGTSRAAPPETVTMAAGARFIAGGTLLVDLLRLEVERPELIVDINALPWTKIEPAGDAVRIGALVKNSDLALDPGIEFAFPALSQALLSGASPQIRNMATVGGKLLQRTRCPYVRDVAVPESNQRKPGSGCAALHGYSRMHAVLGVSDHCIAAHPSAMRVALFALDAVVHTQGPQGERSIALVDFHTLPGVQPEVELSESAGLARTGTA